MGDMAEDILEGTCCSLCCSYFEDKNGDLYTHEEPVVCKTCYKELSNEEKRDWKVAVVDTM